MKTKFIKIGNSFAVRKPEPLILQYGLSNGVEINTVENGILIKAKKKSRVEWAEQLEEAIKAGHPPDGELLEAFKGIEWQEN
jgi:antitoxin component of MazEF toxin-antitoxin module